MEKVEKALYPTWFRWKATLLNDKGIYIELYIPHGSDESDWQKKSNQEFANLYIPHGSDESLW